MRLNSYKSTCTYSIHTVANTHSSVFSYNRSAHLFVPILRTAEKFFDKVKPISANGKLATNDTKPAFRRSNISFGSQTKSHQNHFHKSVFICIHFRLIEIKRAQNITGVHHKILHKIHKAILE